ncbi:MAG TPA: TlyA family RNA methyltransferase [Xanthobacteraceae bacterium]|jgi:23S rRNA (cytidine1920-2'-O)/16S rRNA (cytidine1409-2'-O)-methyltransferase
MSARERADRLLVARGVFDSRAKAQAAIVAGLVTADDRPVRKPSDEIACDARLAAVPAFPWVSRGGVKLAHALDALAVDVADKACLDVGASTGGFTEVLLARGAARVFAVDVGRDQLHSLLRARPEVISIEATDIRALDPARIAPLPEIVVADVSFISLKLALPAALALAAPRATLVALIKPQFEAPRQHRKKGVIRDPATHEAVCADIAGFVATLGWRVLATLPSPIEGGEGNREFFIGAQRD